MRVAKGDRKVKNEAGKPADAAGWLQEAMQRCRTLAKLFGVEKPFLNAPIPGLADAELAAAVSQAGGLGVIAAQRLTPEALRKEIAELRRRTQQPFAVAVEVPPREPAPADAAKPLVEGLSELLVELGLPADMTSYRLDLHSVVPNLSSLLEAIIEIQPRAVIAVGGGFREPEAEALSKAGILHIGTATNLLEVKVLRAAGADAVVLQGSEAAGPQLSFEGESLAPLGLSAMTAAAAKILGNIPVIASGGIASGRQAAGLAMTGAAGFMAGTALLTAAEARLPALLLAKLRLSSAGDLRTMRVLCGRPMRVLASPLTEALGDYERALSISYPAPEAVFRPLAEAAVKTGRDDLVILPAGESVGRSAYRNVREAITAIAGWVSETH